MSGVASKNLFDVLGNDPELDPDRPAEPPVKTVDKTQGRLGKRNTPAEAPRDSGRGGYRGGRHDNASGSELAFRDRGVGRDQNRSKPAEDGYRYDRRPDRSNEEGNYRGRGRGRGRGGRGGAPRDDRHSRTGVSDHEKQVAHGWGGPEGTAELADEKAGEAIAQAEEKEEGFVADTAPQEDDGWGATDQTKENEPEPEPEDKTKSYADYLAEQEEKRNALGGNLELRKPNEGASKKFPQGKEISHKEGDDFISGTGGKNKRVREKKERTLVELDDSRMYKDEERGRGGGRGRGRGRGDRRGDDRGPRGDRGDRPDRPERGDREGGRGRGRGGFRGDGQGRGGRGGRGQSVNTKSETEFPSLGA